jgi:hypothetical protein
MAIASHAATAADEVHGLIATIPVADAPIVISRADALEQWKLKASASRKPWDPTDDVFIPRFDARDALGGDASRASLAFEWQRAVGSGRLEAAAFARRSLLDLYSDLARADGASSGERFEQRDRRGLFTGALRWSGASGLGSFDSSHSLTMRLRAESFDADGVLTAPSREPLATMREDRLRQVNTGFDFANEIELASRLRWTSGLRYDAYRFATQSDLAGHAGQLSGRGPSWHGALIAELPGGSELSIASGRGFLPGDPRVPGAAFDPRTGAPVGRLDPLATLATTEISLRGSWLPQTSTSLGVFRSRSDAGLVFTGDAGLADLTRPTIRQGVELGAHYEPSSRLALDVRAAALRARFADGAAGYVPGAADRGMSAAATMRVPNGWTAMLLVNYLGRRHASEDGGVSVKPSSFVNARLSRNLSKSTRVTFDVFNVFDRHARDIDALSAARFWNQPGAADSFLFNPAEPRGFRIKLRTTF